jgi:F-type H+-transporting ATPase subunit a
MSQPHVSIAAEKLWDLGTLPVTNALLTSWVVMAFFLILGLALRLTLNPKKPGRLQNILELIVEGGFSVIESVTGSAKQAKAFFGVIMTIFLFVLVNNWAGLLPGVGSVGLVHAEESTVEVEAVESTEHSTESATEHTESAAEHAPLTPLFRATSADLSFTLTLALIAVLLTQYHGIRHLGFWHYAGKFIHNPFRSPVMFFVGILELVSEFAKVISFSFRLFGNVFAGEVLLAVVISLIPYIAPMPFYGLELFVGLIQAVVFAMLTLVFFKMATVESH